MFIQTVKIYHFPVPEELEASPDSFWLFQKAEPHINTAIQTVYCQESRLEIGMGIFLLVTDT
jgi:hypothetical protein